MPRDWAKFTAATRVANGLPPSPSLRETLRHTWCMIAHGAHQAVDEIHPQSTVRRITCAKCRVYWMEPKL